MKYETGTFELRDNEMMMRELSSAETNEVAGGTGTVALTAATQSTGAGSAISINADYAFATSSNTAVAALSASVAATGPNNTFLLALSSQVV